MRHPFTPNDLLLWLRWPGRSLLDEPGALALLGPLKDIMTDATMFEQLARGIALRSSHSEALVDALVRCCDDVDDDTRPLAIAALAWTGHPRATACLARLVSHRSPDTRAAAVFALGEMGPPALADVVAAALEDPAESVRDAAQFTLAWGQGPERVEATARMLTSQRSDTRSRALEVLQAIGSDHAMAILQARAGDQADSR